MHVALHNVVKQLMNKSTMTILDHPRFNLEDFSHRWSLARLSALRSVFPDSKSLTEEEFLNAVDSENRDLVLRRVFDFSRKFGMNASRYLEMTFEVSDLVDILKLSNGPCFHGSWRSHNSAYVLERKGCEALGRLGSIACDYWREALDGLVVGVGEDERLARHRSQGHGDSECVDVLFVENYTLPRVVAASSGVSVVTSGKYGPISTDVAAALNPVQKQFQEMKIQLVLEGESEGVLYYRLDADEGVLCGAGGKLLHDSFVRDVGKLFPKLTARDASPLAVYGGST